MKLTFDQLPDAVSQLLDRFSAIEKHFTDGASTPTDVWLSIEELCAYLPGKPAKATIYGYVHNRRIPYHKLSKRLNFLKSEIDSWLHSQSREVQVSETDAADYFKMKGPEQ